MTLQADRARPWQQRAWWSHVGLMAAAATAAAACGGADSPTLGGAEHLAAGGNASWSEVGESLRSDYSGDAIRVDELPLDDAAILIPGSDRESLVVIFDEHGSADSRVTVSMRDHSVRQSSLAPLSSMPTQTAADITASGHFVTATDGDLDRAFTGEPGSPNEPDRDPAVIKFYDPVSVPRREYPSPFLVGALDLAGDGALLAGGLHESRIARIDTDGTTTHLLGPPGSDAQATADPDLGPVVAVMALDDRVAFVAGADGDTHLYLLDDSTVRQIPDDEGTSPVGGTDKRREPIFEEPFPRAAITPLAPSPDGRLLTTGIGPDRDPQIALVDPDTGDIEILAVLDDVEPTVDDPVSAAIIGTDLIFLAQHQLWRLPDVVRADET